MKSATSVIALAASLLPIVFASPLNIERDAEVEVEYKVVTNYEVVTAYATAYATEGEAAPATSSAPVYVAPAPAPEPTTTTVTEGKGRGRKNNWNYNRKSKTSTSTPAPPPPEPTTSSTPPPPPPPPTTTPAPAPAPEPTTTEAPAPPPSPSSVAPVATSSAYVAPAPPSYSPPQVEPSATTGDASYSDANIQAGVLKTTNQYRSQFQAAPLSWNQSLTDMAYKSAQLCDFEHSNAGQNLAAGYSGPSGAVTGWGDEYKQFDFSNPDFSETCGHFTQLVWQDSTTVGCAAKKCPTDGSTPARGWYLICNYFPVGNMLGEFKENVKNKAS